MPAYRSEAEGEIRDEVVKRFRELVPGCRIIHEINAEGFGNRIDVMAVGTEKIWVCEIKSKKDKLDRLRDQIEAMRRITFDVVAALHEKHLDSHEHRGRLRYTVPAEARGARLVWAYPRIERPGDAILGPEWNSITDRRWDRPRLGLPPFALQILHADELKDIAGRRFQIATSKLVMQELVDMIRHEMSGKDVAREICAALRRRTRCAEADPAIDAPVPEVPML